jgi:glycosyltransferase involved in cell wall biosynthesis
MIISFYTSWNNKCGIADYACAIVRTLEKSGTAVTIIPVRDDKKTVHFIADGKQMNHADIAHVQQEYSFFSNSRLPFVYPLLSLWHFFIFTKQIKIPKVITLHEVASVTGRNPLMRFLGYLFLKTYVAIFNDYNHIIVHTDRFRDALVRYGIATEKVTVFPVPVPVPGPGLKISPVQLDADMQAFKHSLSPKTKAIVTIFGFVNARKGHDIALHAMKHNKDCTLIIAGGPQPGDRSRYFDSLGDLVKEFHLEENVKILGFLSDSELHKIMVATDIFIAPFLDASGSASLTRIAAYQKPIIGSDIATITHLKELGLGVQLFRSGQSTDLADTLRRLLNDRDEQNRLIGSTAEFVRRYNYDNFAAYLMSLYERIIRT